MKTGSVLIFYFGVLAALVLLCWVVGFFERNLPSEKFDERQKQVREKANGLAFGFGYVYFLVLYASLELGWELPLDTASLVILGLLMQAMILHIYAVLHNAQLPLGQKPWTAVVLYGSMGFFQLYMFHNRREVLRIANLAAEKGVNMLNVTVESATEDVYLILIFSMIFFSLAAMHLIRQIWPEME